MKLLAVVVTTLALAGSLAGMAAACPGQASKSQTSAQNGDAPVRLPGQNAGQNAG